MGTRSTVQILDESGATLVSLYIQYDGYPDGVGRQIASTFDGAQLVNGFSPGSPTHQVNGMGDAAVRAVVALKLWGPEGKDWNKPGNIYIEKEPGAQEYNYKLFPKGSELHLSVEGYGETFSGSCSSYLKWLEAQRAE